MSKPEPKYQRTTYPSLEQMHAQWELQCVPPTVPRIQSVEMKKAFMGGVASMFHAMKYDIPEGGDDRGCQYLHQLDKELVEFFTKTIYTL